MFHRKKIVTSQTLGEYFRKVRLGKEVPLESAAKETNISLKYLQAIERSAYFDVPIGEVYIVNFIRAYSNFLGVDVKKALQKYSEEKHVGEHSLRFQIFCGTEKFSLLDFLSHPVFLRGASVFLVLSAVAGYFGYQFFLSSSAPPLIISYPTDNLVLSQSNVVVQGTTDPEADITINDEGVLIQNGGAFREEVNLKRGINLIIVKAVKKNKRAAKAVMRVVVVDEKIRDGFLK